MQTEQLLVGRLKHAPTGCWLHARARLFFAMPQCRPTASVLFVNVSVNVTQPWTTSSMEEKSLWEIALPQTSLYPSTSDEIEYDCMID